MEAARGAEPMPERPPVVTFVIVVSVINPSASFQNDCRDKAISQHTRPIEKKNDDFPGDNQGQVELSCHIRVCRRSGL